MLLTSEINEIRERSIDEEAFFVVLGNKDLWLHIKSFMFPGQKSSSIDDYKNGDLAASQGYLSLIKLRENLLFSVNAINYAAENGHLETVQWLHYNRIEEFVGAVKLCCTENVMDLAAKNGHLDTVQWLHINRTEGSVGARAKLCCTENAMNLAAKNGHLDTVQWLHTNRTEGCTKKAIDGAAEKGHLEIVQ